ncbi:MAG: ORF6N domain-containing protein [Elusimicrobiota bacterium]
MPTRPPIPVERIESRILLIRGRRVLLDRHLAGMYGVAPGALNRAVKRNQERFPPDFMLQLTPEEWRDLKRQSGISSWGGDRRAALGLEVTNCDFKMASCVPTLLTRGDLLGGES